MEAAILNNRGRGNQNHITSTLHKKNHQTDEYQLDLLGLALCSIFPMSYLLKQ